MSARAPRELLAYLDRVEPVLDRLSHFDLLDVAPDAGDDAIQRAFHALAARLHPDRHRAVLDPEQRERLMLVYARIAEAYRVLRDPAARIEYGRALAGGDAPPPVEDPEAAVALLSPKAQRLYRRAQASLRTGDAASAVLNLRLALATDPRSALLREALAAAQRRSR